uniref:BED zinc finger protein n=1 Tax=Mimivirus LCMiAC02 TaxID=2506609 RepID=A0A481Z1W3_9VIRU|nr:MAG: BED zinc finger protein [Mimivirus LCMiAC02]
MKNEGIKMDSEKMDTLNDIDDVSKYNEDNTTSDVFDDIKKILHQKPPKSWIHHQKPPKENSHICAYCNKQFSRKDSLTRHLFDRCKTKNKNEEDMKNLLNRLVMQMENLKKEIKSIKGNNTTNNTNTNTNTNSHNTNNVQNNINLLSFGKDNMEGISNEEIKKILKRGFKSIQLMTKKTNFDPDIPENHNVYINNIKSQYAITYNKGRWVLDKTEDVIDRIYDDKYGFLEQKYHELKNELKQYDRKKIERILDQYEGVKISKIFDEIRLILYNNRHIPLRTRKIMNK